MRSLRLHIGDVSAEVLELLFGRGERHYFGAHTLGWRVRGHLGTVNITPTLNGRKIWK